MAKRKIKYKNPIGVDGKPYWVPVVIKNKDQLIGYVRGLEFACDVMDVFFSDTCLDSSRFTDVIAGGQKISEMSDKEKERIRTEIKNKLEEAREMEENGTTQTHEEMEHPDNDISILSETLLNVNCQCGFFMSFKEENEIPSKDVECPICNRKIIHYTGHNDSDYEYDGEEL